MRAYISITRVQINCGLFQSSQISLQFNYSNWKLKIVRHYSLTRKSWDYCSQRAATYRREQIHHPLLEYLPCAQSARADSCSDSYSQGGGDFSSLTIQQTPILPAVGWPTYVSVAQRGGIYACRGILHRELAWNWPGLAYSDIEEHWGGQIFKKLGGISLYIL